jgi:hypothetical protein
MKRTLRSPKSGVVDSLAAVNPSRANEALNATP